MPSTYAAIKHIHMGAAALSISLFILRGGWMLWSPQRLRQPWVRVLPHIIDSVLLAAALWLAWQLGAAAMRGWLVAKIVGLLVYIVLGTIALKRGRTRRTRVAAFVAATAIFGYIVMVAVTKSPLGALAPISSAKRQQNGRMNPRRPQRPAGSAIGDMTSRMTLSCF